MNYLLEKHTNHDFCILKLSGDVFPNDLTTLLKELWQNEQYNSLTHILWDFSQGETHFYFEDIFKLFQFVSSEKQSRGPSTIAIYAPKDTEFGLGRMYATLSESIYPKAMVFRELDKAENWLLENIKTDLNIEKS